MAYLAAAQVVDVAILIVEHLGSIDGSGLVVDAFNDELGTFRSLGQDEVSTEGLHRGDGRAYTDFAIGSYAILAFHLASHHAAVSALEGSSTLCNFAIFLTCRSAIDGNVLEYNLTLGGILHIKDVRSSSSQRACHLRELQIAIVTGKGPSLHALTEYSQVVHYEGQSDGVPTLTNGIVHLHTVPCATLKGIGGSLADFKNGYLLDIDRLLVSLLGEILIRVVDLNVSLASIGSCLSGDEGQRQRFLCVGQHFLIGLSHNITIDIELCPHGFVNTSLLLQCYSSHKLVTSVTYGRNVETCDCHIVCQCRKLESLEVVKIVVVVGEAELIDTSLKARDGVSLPLTIGCV